MLQLSRNNDHRQLIMSKCVKPAIHIHIRFVELLRFQQFSNLAARMAREFNRAAQTRAGFSPEGGGERGRKRQQYFGKYTEPELIKSRIHFQFHATSLPCADLHLTSVITL